MHNTAMLLHPQCLFEDVYHNHFVPEALSKYASLCTMPEKEDVVEDFILSMVHLDSVVLCPPLAHMQGMAVWVSYHAWLC